MGVNMKREEMRPQRIGSRSPSFRRQCIQSDLTHYMRSKSCNFPNVSYERRAYLISRGDTLRRNNTTADAFPWGKRKTKDEREENRRSRGGRGGNVGRDV